MKTEEIQKRLKESVIRKEAPISEALAQMDKAGTGALLLCDDAGCLLGLIANGDLRRALLRGIPLSDACESIASRHPITARSPVSSAEALRIMNDHVIDQLPVVDDKCRVQLLLLRRDLLVETEAPPQAQERLKLATLKPGSSISEAMSQLDQAGTGALLICAPDGALLSIVTDGDIRRAILRGQSLTAPCESIASSKPITAYAPMPHAEALKVMNQNGIDQLPLLDAQGRVQMLLLRRDVMVERGAALSAVVMVGGYGTRLRPLTESVPKPMLPVGEKPLLELTISQLRRAGIKEVNLTTHYLPESISNHFGGGESFGVKLNYLHEENPLGTAGGLKLLKKIEDTLLVINGDILTGAPFSAMLTYHRQHRADITVGVRKYEIQVPFGVVECDDVRVTRLQEKPALSFFINAGTYLIEPSTCDFIPPNRRFDMTDLIQKLLEMGGRVVSFPIVEYWLDIGKHEDYLQAQADVREGKIK